MLIKGRSHQERSFLSFFATQKHPHQLELTVNRSISNKTDLHRAVFVLFPNVKHAAQLCFFVIGFVAHGCLQTFKKLGMIFHGSEFNPFLAKKKVPRRFFPIARVQDDPIVRAYDSLHSEIAREQDLQEGRHKFHEYLGDLIDTLEDAGVVAHLCVEIEKDSTRPLPQEPFVNISPSPRQASQMRILRLLMSDHIKQLFPGAGDERLVELVGNVIAHNVEALFSGVLCRLGLSLEFFHSAHPVACTKEGAFPFCILLFLFLFTFFCLWGTLAFHGGKH